MALTTTGTDPHELFTGGFWSDPYPAYAALRESEPVRKLALPDGEMWLLTRHADVREAFVDPRLSKDWRYTLPEEQRADMPAAPTPMMILMDPPDHTRLRKLVSRSFTVRRMSELQPRVEEIAADLLARMPEDGTVDLMREYAFLVPVQVICELLGVPAEDRDDFSAWSSVLVDESPADDKNAAMGKLYGYLSELIARKRTEPDDALLSSLIEVSDTDGDRLSSEELVAMAVMLLIAGHETTVNLIGNGVLALLTHPDELARLQADPSLITSAVEEFLRFDSPVAQAPIRFTAEEVTYSGVTIPAGEMVMLGLAAANRDGDWVERPDQLDLGRDTSGGVFFGHGVHFCLGAQLARIEGRVAIGKLVADRPDLALAVDPSELTHRQSTLVRGLTNMPVAPGPRA
ncbi:cytochrome P450 family protein [Pseudonocardia nantongensis]|uniref:cytochrome P450 family protein n=1 Tax=Pseudonocardia nantongensis TaxID=1181885 RepID=UPI00397CFCF4